ncbi:MAG TPA: hypothetical protein VGV38_02240 [Pyrinomonadaceae bacterium]|nr:hypothetical protein [Pyrinomonadaceae bacterium]
MAFPENQQDPREPVPTLRATLTWTVAPPDSPAGGPGPGGFSVLQPYGRASAAPFQHHAGFADPEAQDWSERLRDWTPDALDGVLCVQQARDRSLLYVPEAIASETGRRLEEILEGILPGLLMALVAVAVPTAIGAVAGGVAGAFAGGVGAIPGAGAGAVAGAKIGLVILTWLGLAMLVDYVAENISRVGDLVIEGVKLAWEGRGKPRHVRDAAVDAGARKMAQAVGLFFLLLLEAVVMYLLAKGAGAVAQRIPALVEQLRRSRLGAGFARWIERNAASLVNDPKLNPNLRPKNQGGAGGQGSGGGGGREAGNAARHEQYKTELRRQMEKPHADDPRLQNIINENYRPNAKIGSGSTADAIRHERATGQPVGGRWHTQKGQDTVRALEKWLKDNPAAKPGDRAAAENVIKDLKDALGQ